MMDERNDDDFNIVLPQEQEICKLLPRLKFVLLTGEAGALLEGKTGKKYILAANIGIFMKTALKYQLGLIEKLKDGGKDVLVINFERRNLAADERLF